MFFTLFILHKSDKNKVHRSQSQIIHTSGRVSMGKRRSDMIGSKLGSIDCFKKFHKKKDGETWATEKAKNVWDQMDHIRSIATSEGSTVNEWEINLDVTGEPSCGCVHGLGTGIKGKDVYGSGSSQTCSKRCKEIQKMKEKEWEDSFQ
ncbi:putative transposase, Ptta/En/Spm, plant [Dioscorea sansibarensis]